MVSGYRIGRAAGAAAGSVGWRAFVAVAALLFPCAAIAAPSPLANPGAGWKVFKEAWTADDEKAYEAFVQAIGRSDCTSLEECLEDEANPWRGTDKRLFHGDCADMAYMLRAYFAWKNGLPFSYQNAMRTADGSAQDLRYSSNGNVVAGRRQIINSTGNAPHFIQRIGSEVSTAMFRTDPEKGGGRLYDDFYPIEISRESVRPGVIAYDIYGHVGIVYDVLDDGRVLVVASHPDNSVTRTTFGPNFLRAKPALGAGLKAWRPVYVEGAKRAADGSLHGGKLKAAANDAIPDFSLEQYIGNAPHPSGEWHYGEFRFKDRTLSYYDYVRRKLAAPDFAYNPVDELRHGLETICGSILDRKIAIDRAVAAGVHRQPHPKKLPPNIFGTYGEWEEYSTPSRDARLKVSFIELRRTMQELVEHHGAGDPSVRYGGNNLGRDLWEAFEEEKNACAMTYRRSDDNRVRLNLGHVMDRLWDLSFDPYHCPERRWGAKGAELESCTDDGDKTRWYNAQRFLRYQAERTYDVRMDFTVDELQPPMGASPAEGGLGVEAPADGDVRKYLAALNNMTLARGEAAPELLAISAEPESWRPVFPAWHARER
jgi:hypothetical protein